MTSMLPSTELQTSAQSCKERDNVSNNRTALGQEIDHNEPPGFADLKPEGEGETEASKRASQSYKHPVHGEETATTAF